MRSVSKSTFGIVLGVMVLFAVTAFFVAQRTAKMMVAEAEKTVRSLVKNTTSQIDLLTSQVETAVANHAWVIREHLKEPDYMYHVTREIVQNNAKILGSTVAFEPNYYPEKGYYFAPYTCREGTGFKSIQLGNPDNYRYHEWDWYKPAFTQKRAIWSEPYVDEGGGQVLMSTYSLPIFNAQSNVCAIFTADLSLADLAQHVKSICPYPQSYAVMSSAKGKVLVPPPEGHSTDNDEDGTITIHDHAKNGWSVAVVCPIEEILNGAYKLFFRILAFSGIGLVAIFVIAWLYSSRLERVSAMRERMAGELNAARGIQEDMLPRHGTDNFFGLLRPAREVGGDLYDFVQIDDTLYFIVGDASGKGLSAALYSFMAGTVFRLACDLRLDPGAILGRINTSLAYNNERCMFVTAFVGALNLKTGAFAYACAGHPAPLLVTSGAPVTVLSTVRRPPTGALEGTAYPTSSTEVPEGAKLVVYTDGVTEAERTDHEQYGEARLQACVAAASACNVHEMTQRILASVDAFVQGAEQFDDITIVTLQRPPNA